MENHEADTLSRVQEMSMEWMLNVKWFQHITKYFNCFPEIDLFASRLNKQIDKFVSYLPDPDAMHVNAFTLDWSKFIFYCFPPFACIGRIIRKIIQDEAVGILVTPDWPTQYWYPLLEYISKITFVIPSSNTQLSLPNRTSELHPLRKTLVLKAWLVSAKH